MKTQSRTRSFTDTIASQTENSEIKHALQSGSLSVLCDPKQKKFWFGCCPEHLWDAVISEIKSLTGFTPLVDDSDSEFGDEDELAFG